MLFRAWWRTNKQTNKQPGEPRASLLVEHWAKQTFLKREVGTCLLVLLRVCSSQLKVPIFWTRHGNVLAQRVQEIFLGMTCTRKNLGMMCAKKDVAEGHAFPSSMKGKLILLFPKLSLVATSTWTLTKSPVCEIEYKPERAEKLFDGKEKTRNRL